MSKTLIQSDYFRFLPIVILPIPNKPKDQADLFRSASAPRFKWQRHDVAEFASRRHRCFGDRKYRKYRPDKDRRNPLDRRDDAKRP